MKIKLVFLACALSCLGLQAQKLQVGVAYAPEFDYFQGQRLAYGFDYSFRLAAFVEFNPVERIGIRGSLFPSVYGATYTGGGNPFGQNGQNGQSVEQFSRIDLDISGEVHYYMVEVNNVTIKGIVGMLFPANVFERVFYFNQSFGEQNGINFLTPEIMLGPGISWNSGRSFNTIIELLYRRRFDSFSRINRPSVASIEFRIGLSWVLLGKN